VGDSLEAIRARIQDMPAGIQEMAAPPELMLAQMT
jgi:hypothetical protein